MKETHAFWRELAHLEATHARRLAMASAELPELGLAVGPTRKRSNAWGCRRLIRLIVDHVERLPHLHEEHGWRSELQARVREIGTQHLDWPQSYRELVVGDAFIDSTLDFIRTARAFDPRISVEDIGQALRNVWIANTLQMLLDEDVKLTPAVFAYSMLYPYTDNYLDDVAVEAAKKREFNVALGRRLRGYPVAAVDARERNVFRLVGMIENQLPREVFPDVHRSLSAIHRAQVASLEQDGRETLSPRRIIELSLAKGGASVLADGYLVAGTLTPSEAELCFGYGVGLQLLDDLQDVERDKREGHQTIFTAAGREEADLSVNRLFHYLHEVVEGSSRFAAARHEPCRDLILRNCVWLLTSALADCRTRHGDTLLAHYERSSSLSFEAIVELRAAAAREVPEARSHHYALDALREVGPLARSPLASSGSYGVSQT